MLLPLLLATALQTPAADSAISGAWRITGDVMGNPVNEACTFKQADSTLTGTCRNTDAAGAKTYDVTGSVKSGRVTFTHGGEYQGSALTITYAGTLASAPKALTGTIDVQPFGVTGTFSAAPASGAPASAAPASAPAKP